MTATTKTIINIEKPITQSVEAVKALLSWRGRAADPLPSFIEMGKEESRLVLVLSNKQDAYYTVTARDCSCPAAIYHHGPCKHQRKYFPESKAATKPAAIVMERKPFKPFIEDEARPAKVSAPSFEMVDTTPDANPREVAYWSIQEDKTMLPTLGEA
jgi:hypothetical protein